MKKQNIKFLFEIYINRNGNKKSIFSISVKGQ